MLLPALNAAKGKAKDSLCINNLKNTALLMQFYYNDYHEICPGPEMYAEGGVYVRWNAIAYHYSGKGSSIADAYSKISSI